MRREIAIAAIMLPLIAARAVALAAAPAVRIAVSEAWVRSLPGGAPAAGYMKIHNAGKAPVTLTGVRSAACGTLMMHKSGASGAMEMVMTLPIPAGGDVRFSPGGYHLMCEKPAASVKPGAKMTVTLLFADGSTSNIEFQVRDAKGN